MTIDQIAERLQAMVTEDKFSKDYTNDYKLALLQDDVAMLIAELKPQPIEPACTWIEDDEFEDYTYVHYDER